MKAKNRTPKEEMSENLKLILNQDLSQYGTVELNKQADKVTDKQTDKVTDKQTDKVTDRQTDKVTDRQTDQVTDRQTDQVTDDYIKFQWMTKAQKIVYSYLLTKTDKITNSLEISNKTGIPYGTVRGIIRFLVKENFIAKPIIYRRGSFRGISYELNNKVSKKFKKEVR